MQKRSFEYVRRSREDVLAVANASNSEFDSFLKSNYRKYKVRDGKNMIRILPPTWESPHHYGYPIWINYEIGADRQAYLSLAKMKGERDPIAEAYLEADREGNDKLAKALRATRRVAMWVIDRQAEEEGPLFWAAPSTVDKDIATLSSDEDTTECLMIDDPADGYDVRFYKEGQGKEGTKYPAAKIKLLGPTPLHSDMDQDKAQAWLQFVKENPIPACLNYYSYDHISRVFNGNVRMDDEKKRESQTPNEPRRAAGGTLSGEPQDYQNEGNGSGGEAQEPNRRLRPVETPDEEDIGAAIKARLARTAQTSRTRRSMEDDD